MFKAGTLIQVTIDTPLSNTRKPDDERRSRIAASGALFASSLITMGLTPPVVVCESFDLEASPPMDLSNKGVQKEKEAQAEKGDYDAAVAGPPCRTFSAALYRQDNGPKPYRSRACPWGLPNLPQWARERVQLDSSLLLFTLKFLQLVAVAGGGGLA